MQKKNLPERRVYDVSPKKFIEVWQASESAAEVAEKLGMPKPIVLARASNYRALGIKIKSMRAKRPGLNVQELNKLIEANGVQEPTEVPSPSRKKQSLPVSDDKVASVVREVLRSIGRGDKPT